VSSDQSAEGTVFNSKLRCCVNVCSGCPTLWLNVVPMSDLEIDASAALCVTFDLL
jgi:hypothetical protein